MPAVVESNTPRAFDTRPYSPYWNEPRTKTVSGYPFGVTMPMSYQHWPVQNSKVAKRGSPTEELVRSFQPPGAAALPPGTTAVSSAMSAAAGRRASSMRQTWLNEVSGAGKPLNAPVAPVAA